MQYGVELMEGADGYYLRPWILSPGQVEPDRGTLAGPIPSRAAAEELAAGMIERMKAAVERSLQDVKLQLVRSSPACEHRPGDETKPFRFFSEE